MIEFLKKLFGTTESSGGTDKASPVVDRHKDVPRQAKVLFCTAEPVPEAEKSLAEKLALISQCCHDGGEVRIIQYSRDPEWPESGEAECVCVTRMEDQPGFFVYFSRKRVYENPFPGRNPDGTPKKAEREMLFSDIMWIRMTEAEFADCTYEEFLFQYGERGVNSPRVCATVAKLVDMKRLWNQLLELIPPSGPEDHTIRNVIASYSWPLEVDHLAEAREYHGMFLTYLVCADPKYTTRTLVLLEKKENGGTVSRRQMNVYYGTQPENPEHYRSLFLRFRQDLLLGLPHKTVYLGEPVCAGRGGLHASADCPEIHMFAPVRGSPSGIFILAVHSVYNGSPMEGGAMEGFTFVRALDVPAEDYELSDEALAAKYTPAFEGKV